MTLRPALLATALLTACADPCAYTELVCDGPCPTLADVDPRVTGAAEPCTFVSECVTADGTRFVRVADVSDLSPVVRVFDEGGTLVAIERSSDVVGAGRCAAIGQGLEVGCVTDEVVFRSCGDGT